MLTSWHIIWQSFMGLPPPNLKGIGANTLNYKPIFDHLGKKMVGCGLAYSACKNFRVQRSLGAKIWYSEKVDFMGTIAPLNLCG